MIVYIFRMLIAAAELYRRQTFDEMARDIDYMDEQLMIKDRVCIF